MRMPAQSSDVDRNAALARAEHDRAVRRRHRGAIGREIASLAMLAAIAISLAALSLVCVGALAARASSPAAVDGVAGMVRGSLSLPMRDRVTGLIA